MRHLSRATGTSSRATARSTRRNSRTWARWKSCPPPCAKLHYSWGSKEAADGIDDLRARSAGRHHPRHPADDRRERQVIVRAPTPPHASALRPASVAQETGGGGGQRAAAARRQEVKAILQGTGRGILSRASGPRATTTPASSASGAFCRAASRSSSALQDITGTQAHRADARRLRGKCEPRDTQHAAGEPHRLSSRHCRDTCIKYFIA